MVGKLLKVEEVAEMLGLKPATVYQLVFKGKIPCIKISRRAVRFEQGQILEWLKTKTQQPEAATMPVPKPVRRSVTRPKKSNRKMYDYVRSLADAVKKEVLS